MSDPPDHTTRVTNGGFVICVCGWATSAGEEENPRELAARHIQETAPPETSPLWVKRPGGTVCEPG